MTPAQGGAGEASGAGAERVLLTGGGYDPAHLARLAGLGFEVVHREEIGPAELAELLPTIDAYVLGGDERLDAELLGRAERLRVISFVGTGFGDFIDAEAAARGNIAIRNTPGVASPAVVEHTMGMLLGLVRGLFAHNDAVKRGGTAPGSTPELSSLTVGIVGLGDIGTRVARTLRLGFGARVCYASPTPKPALEAELGLERLELPELFAGVDAVVLLASTSPATIGLVGEELLAGSDRPILLVNTAGARLVDPVALRAALERGRVTAAAFDGYWIEPLPAVADDPYGLLGFPDARFVVTPHVAAKTPQTWQRMVGLAVDNLASHR
jgi:phosphoglycerate dehydrogenase-like enzyme